MQVLQHSPSGQLSRPCDGIPRIGARSHWCQTWCLDFSPAATAASGLHPSPASSSSGHWSLVMNAMPIACRRSHSQHLSLFPDCVPDPPPCSLQFLGYGDLASITTACPRLSKLSLTGTSLFKSALAPLAQLSGLKTLHLRNISLFARHTCLLSPA